MSRSNNNSDAEWEAFLSRSPSPSTNRPEVVIVNSSPTSRLSLRVRNQQTSRRIQPYTSRSGNWNRVSRAIRQARMTMIETNLPSRIHQRFQQIIDSIEEVIPNEPNNQSTHNSTVIRTFANYRDYLDHQNNFCPVGVQSVNNQSFIDEGFASLTYSNETDEGCRKILGIEDLDVEWIGKLPKFEATFEDLTYLKNRIQMLTKSFMNQPLTLFVKLLLENMNDYYRILNDRASILGPNNIGPTWRAQFYNLIISKTAKQATARSQLEACAMTDCSAAENRFSKVMSFECGHLMHQACYQNHLEKREWAHEDLFGNSIELPCPACRAPIGIHYRARLHYAAWDSVMHMVLNSNGKVVPWQAIIKYLKDNKALVKITEAHYRPEDHEKFKANNGGNFIFN